MCGEQVGGPTALLAVAAADERIVGRQWATQCRMDERGHHREGETAWLGEVVGLCAERADLAEVGAGATTSVARQGDRVRMVMGGHAGDERWKVDGGWWHAVNIAKPPDLASTDCEQVECER